MVLIFLIFEVECPEVLDYVSVRLFGLLPVLLHLQSAGTAVQWAAKIWVRSHVLCTSMSSIILFHLLRISIIEGGLWYYNRMKEKNREFHHHVKSPYLSRASLFFYFQFSERKLLPTPLRMNQNFSKINFFFWKIQN